jgi:hypothetical protein
VSRPATARTNCGACELPLRWEPIEDRRGGERWLAVCSCGMPWVFFPGRPGLRPRDPLRAALLSEAAPAESPPWIRLFQLSSRHPWWLPWRHVARTPYHDVNADDLAVLGLRGQLYQAVADVRGSSLRR